MTTDLRPGAGGLKYYSYWVADLRPLKTKEAVLKAISLKLPLRRKDKQMNRIEKFDYAQDRFVKEE